MEPERLKILLIEHDVALACGISGMLEQARDVVERVDVAASLVEAVGRLGTETYDAILLELFLPDGAGLANLPMLKARAPRVPVVVVGTVDDDALAMQAVHAGAQDYLAKNQLSPRWLLRAIRYAIERHRADMALLDAEAQYRNLFDHLTEGIFRTTREGRYLLANAALARMYGYASAEELMREISDIGGTIYVQPGRREEFIRLMDEQDTISNFESPIFRKDGHIIWISEDCRAIRDAEGRLLYYEGTVRDITERRAAEENLRNSEALYHSLVETLPQNIFRKDLQGRFTFANQQFCRTLGRRLEEILGKTDYDFFPPELAAKYQHDDARVIATGQNYNTVEEHQLPDGRKIFVQVVKTPLRSAYNQINGLQGIFWDVTEQRLAEERIRKVNEALARSREELRRKNAQMQADLKMASEIQRALLPVRYPVFPPGVQPQESALQFTHRYAPTGEVGGDFFSVSALSDTEAAVFLCDVAGHGVRSALITAMIRALIEELKPLAGDPGAFLTKLNSELYTMLKDAGTPVLTTAFYLVANASDGRVRYANAGHPKPLHLQRRADTVTPLPNRPGQLQPALGWLDGATYQTTEVRLRPRDMIMLYTDGLYEVHAANQELYSQAMLETTVHHHLQSPMPALFDQVLAEIRDFAQGEPFDDDVCVLGVEFLGGLAVDKGGRG